MGPGGPGLQRLPWPAGGSGVRALASGCFGSRTRGRVRGPGTDWARRSGVSAAHTQNTANHGGPVVGLGSGGACVLGGWPPTAPNLGPQRAPHRAPASDGQPGTEVSDLERLSPRPQEWAGRGRSPASRPFPQSGLPTGHPIRDLELSPPPPPQRAGCWGEGWRGRSIRPGWAVSRRAVILWRDMSRDLMETDQSWGSGVLRRRRGY